MAHRHIPTKKWQRPCGKVLPTVQTPKGKACGIQSSRAHHTDRMGYGKVVPDFFLSSVASNISRLSMLLSVEKHPELLGAIRLASILVAAGAAVVAELVPTLPVPHPDEGSIDVAVGMNLDAPIPLRERQCPRVLPRQAPLVQQLQRMYPVVRGNFEKSP